jgi:hypothetical protein
LLSLAKETLTDEVFQYGKKKISINFDRPDGFLPVLLDADALTHRQGQRKVMQTQLEEMGM